MVVAVTGAAAVVDIVAAVAAETEGLRVDQETGAINFSCKIYSQIIASSH